MYTVRVFVALSLILFLCCEGHKFVHPLSKVDFKRAVPTTGKVLVTVHCFMPSRKPVAMYPQPYHPR